MEEATQPTITRIVVLSCYLVTCTQKAIHSLHSARRQSGSNQSTAKTYTRTHPKYWTATKISDGFHYILFLFWFHLFAAIFRTQQFFANGTTSSRSALPHCCVSAEYVCAREDIKNPKSHFVYCLPAQSSVRFTGFNFKPRLYMFLRFASIFYSLQFRFHLYWLTAAVSSTEYSVGDIPAPNLIFYLWCVCVCVMYSFGALMR